MFFEFDTINDDGFEVRLKLPAQYVVCHRCRGTGTHVNEAIDGNGITQSDREDWADDDFMENYMAGAYDVVCTVCKGERVVLEIDRDACKRNAQYAEALQEYDDQQRELQISYAIERQERMMGA